MQLLEEAGAISGLSQESDSKQSFQPREERDIFMVFWILKI
jgi:hypothetical protein